MDFFDRVQLITEKFLTHREKARRIKKEKRRGKSAVIDWIEAFLWAACMVLLLNQYLVQAYRIPSGSMIDTLNIGDHVFVNKIVYGPELLPGFFKLPSPVSPKRNDIIIFENPSYISRGTVFDVVQRIVYMLTLTLVDIDKDDSGDPRVHFLIKRAAAFSGDSLMFENGELKIRFKGEDRWVDERSYNAARGWNHNITRLINPGQYDSLAAEGKADGWKDRGFQITQQLAAAASQAGTMKYSDYLTYERAWLETLRKAAPHDSRYAARYAKNRIGLYIPESRIFPMGDYRDNSRDGRHFGAVKLSKVLGKGMVIYWPFLRINGIK